MADWGSTTNNNNNNSSAIQPLSLNTGNVVQPQQQPNKAKSASDASNSQTVKRYETSSFVWDAHLAKINRTAFGNASFRPLQRAVINVFVFRSFRVIGV
jgi:hypothetical protein